MSWHLSIAQLIHFCSFHPVLWVSPEAPSGIPSTSDKFSSRSFSSHPHTGPPFRFVHSFLRHACAHVPASYCLIPVVRVYISLRSSTIIPNSLGSSMMIIFKPHKLRQADQSSGGAYSTLDLCACFRLGQDSFSAPTISVLLETWLPWGRAQTNETKITADRPECLSFILESTLFSAFLVVSIMNEYISSPPSAVPAPSRKQAIHSSLQHAKVRPVCQST